jgi:hypothetical protein
MEHLTTRILPRSSDAIVIIRLADGTVTDLNEAFFAATGHAQHELVGSPSDDLLVRLGPTADPTIDKPQEFGSIADVPIGLWTRLGDLVIGRLSSLVLEVEGQRVALCTIREVRKPTPGERASAARAELDRIFQSHGRGPKPATMALRAFGRCLRWEFGALWRGAPDAERLRCTAVWRAPQSDLERLEELTRTAAFPHGLNSLGRAWLRGESTWIPDASADSGFSRSRGRAGESAHGWLGFPVWGPGGVIGAAEFLSNERRQSDARLLAMIDDFGHLFGRLLDDLEPPHRGFSDADGAVSSESRKAPPATVSGAFRELAGAVAAATEALERHPTVAAQVEPPALGALTAGIGKLNRLLEDATDRRVDASPVPGPRAPDAETTIELPRELPTGLTLKAVSRRTGIPAATLRTWQRRYGFMRPMRSPSGYRLYGEEEINRIEQVKYLVEQGVRIGAAMDAVIRAAEGPSGGSEGVQPAG